MEETRSAPKITIVFSARVREVWQAVQRLQEEIKAIEIEYEATTYDQVDYRKGLNTRLHSLHYELAQAKVEAYDVMRAYQIIEPISPTPLPPLRDRIIETLTDRGVFTYPPVAFESRRQWAERIADAICDR